MRILLTHVYAWPDVRRGGERYLHEAGASLAAAGHDVSILTTSSEPRKGEVLGVPVRYLPQRTKLRRYGELSVEVCFGYEALVREALARVDVWHAFGTADAAAAAQLSRVRRGVRAVYTDLGNPARWWRDERPDKALFDRVVRDVDEYLCLSDYSNAMLVRDYGRRGRVVGGGVDLRRFSPGDRSSVPTLLFSGRVDEPRKNFALLLDAVELMLERGYQVRLVVSGPGHAGPALSRAAPEVRAVVDVLGVGSVDDLSRIYASAWVTVLPSVDEAFGLVLVESLACGTPIVALADGGGPAELVTPEVGVLAASPSASALADACAAALDLAGRPATVPACRAAAAGHDWRTAVVPKLEAAYRGV